MLPRDARCDGIADDWSDQGISTPRRRPSKRLFLFLHSTFEVVVVCLDAADHGAPDFLEIVAREDQNLGGVQVSPGLLSEQFRQTLGSGYKVGLPPGMPRFRVVEFYVQLVSESLRIIRTGYSVGFL